MIHLYIQGILTLALTKQLDGPSPAARISAIKNKVVDEAFARVEFSGVDFYF